MRSKRPDRIAALCWLALAAFACTSTMWAAQTLGAEWRLYTALGIAAGLGMLCCTAGGRDG